MARIRIVETDGRSLRGKGLQRPKICEDEQWIKGGDRDTGEKDTTLVITGYVERDSCITPID